MPPLCSQVQIHEVHFRTLVNFHRFKTVGNLTAHLSSCHDPVETGMLKKFNCKFCSKSFRFPAQVKSPTRLSLTFFLFRSSNMSGSTPKRSPSIVSSVAKDSLSNATWKLILKPTKVLMSELSSVPNAITQQPLYHCWSCTCIHTLVSGHLFANCAVRAIKDLPTWGGIRRTCASWGRGLPWIREMVDLVVRLKRAGSTKQ